MDAAGKRMMLTWVVTTRFAADVDADTVEVTNVVVAPARLAPIPEDFMPAGAILLRGEVLTEARLVALPAGMRERFRDRLLALLVWKRGMFLGKSVADIPTADLADLAAHWVATGALGNA